MNVLVIYTPYPNAAMVVAPFLSAANARKGIEAMRHIWPGMVVEAVTCAPFARTVDDAMSVAKSKPCEQVPDRGEFAELGIWLKGMNPTSTIDPRPVHAGGFMGEDDM